jgi:hypothetical protein
MTETPEQFAARMVATQMGAGMKPPFYADVASVKGDQSCGYIVRNSACNSLGVVGFDKAEAEVIAAEMNRLTTG